MLHVPSMEGLGAVLATKMADMPTMCSMPICMWTEDKTKAQWELHKQQPRATGATSKQERPRRGYLLMPRLRRRLGRTHMDR